MRSSQGGRARKEFAAAEAERVRRVGDGLRFASVRHALCFMWERAPSMQSALSHHPRGHLAKDGSTVYLQVDGGGGGDIDELLSTLQTIHDTLATLRIVNPFQYQIVVAHYHDRKRCEDIADLVGRSATFVSREIAKADSFMLYRLWESGVVMPPSGGVPA